MAATLPPWRQFVLLSAIVGLDWLLLLGPYDNTVRVTGFVCTCELGVAIATGRSSVRSALRFVRRLPASLPKLPAAPSLLPWAVDPLVQPTSDSAAHSALAAARRRAAQRHLLRRRAQRWLEAEQRARRERDLVSAFEGQSPYRPHPWSDSTVPVRRSG